MTLDVMHRAGRARACANAVGRRNRDERGSRARWTRSLERESIERCYSSKAKVSYRGMRPRVDGIASTGYALASPFLDAPTSSNSRWSSLTPDPDPPRPARRVCRFPFLVFCVVVVTHCRERQEISPSCKDEMGASNMNEEMKMRIQSLMTPATFIVSADVLPMRR